jgi:hypothetical protein
VAAWQRCDRCRRVLGVEEFDGDGTQCRACLTTPVARPKVAKASPVRTRSTTPREPVPAGPRQPLLGIAGQGDLEVRERRARRRAQDALVEAHPEEFEQLLAAARQVEGLRA